MNKFYGVNYIRIQTDAIKDKEKSLRKWFPVKVPDNFSIGYSDGRFIAVIPEDHFYLQYTEADILKVDDLFLNVKSTPASPAELLEKGKYVFRKIAPCEDGACEPVYINNEILKNYFYPNMVDFFITDSKSPVYLIRKGTSKIAGIILPCNVHGGTSE